MMKSILFSFVLVFLLLISCDDNQVTNTTESSTLVIIDFSPKIVKPNDTVTIYGKNFSSDIKQYKILIGNTAVPTIFGLKIEKKSCQISFIVPSSAKTDKIKLCIDTNYVISKDNLTISSTGYPNVGLMYPPSGCPGTMITIPGSGFYAYRNTIKVLLNNNEFKPLNVTDTTVQFILPDTKGQFDVYLKLDDTKKITLTNENAYNIYKLLIGTDENVTVWPPCSYVGGSVTIKMGYFGNSKPRVFFGKVEAEVVNYYPWVFQYRTYIGHHGTEIYDGYITVKVPDVANACKIKIETDCGTYEVEKEFILMKFRRILAVVNNLYASVKRVEFDGDTTYIVSSFHEVFPELTLSDLTGSNGKDFHFYYNGIKTNSSNTEQKGQRYNYDMNIEEKSFHIGFDDFNQTSGKLSKWTDLNYDISLKNAEYYETTNSYVYYLKGKNLINNISASWKGEQYNGNFYFYQDTFHDFYNITDSSFVAIVLVK